MAKHQKNKGHFAGVPSVVMRHPDYINLSFSAKALLFEFSLQYFSNNNGKLCAIYKQLKQRGWKSEATLRKALRELLEANLIVITKVGIFGSGKRQPNYYAITWQPVDEIKGFSMDISSTVTPLRKFSIELREVKNDEAA